MQHIILQCVLKPPENASIPSNKKATAIVGLYELGGVPLDGVCWPSDLAAATEGFTALHYHSKEA